MSMENNNANQDVQNNQIAKPTLKDRALGFVRRNFTVKKVLGAAAFGAAAFGAGYAVGHKKNKPEEPVTVEEPTTVEEPVEEELLKINDEQLADMGLEYEPNEEKGDEA